jgi:hypothetical protein
MSLARRFSRITGASLMAGKDFNVNNVPKSVSDPHGFHRNGDFPKHVHRYDVDPDYPTLGPSRREMQVENEDELATAENEGWLIEPPKKPAQPKKPAPAVAQPPAK